MFCCANTRYLTISYFMPVVNLLRRTRLISTVSNITVPRTYDIVLFRMFDMPDVYGPSEILQLIGGSHQTNIVYIRETTPKVRQVLAICTGSALAARAGILNGKKATANKSSWPTTVAANPNTTWVPSARWVEDYSSSPPIWSSSGVTAGIDMMLHWVEQTYSAENATSIARFIEHVRITDSSIDPFARNETVAE